MEGGRRVFASESGEVFTKQDLTTERQRPSKAVGRPKRKERKSKGGSQMNSQDIMRKIKLSSEMVSLQFARMYEAYLKNLKLHASDKENSETITSLISKNRISHKVGLYSKSKSSETISRRKPLEGLKLTESAANAAKNDLRRVIGSCLTNPLAPVPNPSVPAPNPSTASPALDTPTTARPSPNEPASNHPPPAVMEISPCEPPQPKVLPPLHDIAMRVLDGLRPEQVFRCGSRLKESKQELRDMIKQQNLSLYQLLTQCVHQGQTLTPHLKVPSRELPKTSSEPAKELEYVPTVRSEAVTSAERTDLSACFGQLPLPPCNPTSTQDLRAFHHPNGNSDPSSLLPPHHGNYKPSQITGVLLHNPVQSSADFLDIVDDTTPLSWLPTVPSPSPDRPKLFPHRLY